MCSYGYYKVICGSAQSKALLKLTMGKTQQITTLAFGLIDDNSAKCLSVHV